MAIPRVDLAPGYSIARVINGCWQLAEGHGGNVAAERDVMNRFSELLEHGFDTFDCADIYTGVEALLGRFIARCGDPERIRVHTKFVPDLAQLGHIGRRQIEAVIHRSLDRLGVERLDLVQFHWWDYAVPGYLDALDALDGLRRAGKIRLLGLTNFDTHRVAELADTGVPLASIQLQYSLLDRRPEQSMARLCRSRDIAMLPYGVLAGGLLAGSSSAQSSANRSLAKYRLVLDEAGGPARLQALLEALDAVAERHGCLRSAVAARWVLSRPGVPAIILGTGTRSRVKDNLAMTCLQLSQADFDRIDSALAGLKIPPGNVFEMERDFDGPHAAIMKMNLNADNTE
jgi:aryl-alcohol dehydrogenase-like predicted oxidoreductase